MKKVLGTIIRKPALLLGLLAVVVLAGGLVLAMISSRKSSENRSQAASAEAHPRFYFVPDTESDVNPSTKNVLEVTEVGSAGSGGLSSVGRLEIKVDVPSQSEPIIAADLMISIPQDVLSRINIVNFVPNSGQFGGVTHTSINNGQLRLVVVANPGNSVSGSGRNLGNLQLQFKPPAVADNPTTGVASIAIISAKYATPTRVVAAISNTAGQTSLDGVFMASLSMKYVKPAQAASQLGTCQCANSAVVATANRCATNAKAICVGANACGCAQSISCQDLKMTDISNPPRIISSVSAGQTVGFKFTMNNTGQTSSAQWDARIKLAQVSSAGVGEYVQFGSSRFNPFTPSPMFGEMGFMTNSWSGVNSVTYLMNFRHPLTITENGVNTENYLWCNPSGGGQWQILDLAGQPKPQYSVAGSTATDTKCTNLCTGVVTVGSTPPQPSPTPTSISTPTPTVAFNCANCDAVSVSNDSRFCQNDVDAPGDGLISCYNQSPPTSICQHWDVSRNNRTAGEDFSLCVSRCNCLSGPTPVILSPTPTPTPKVCPICQYYQPSTQSCVNVENDTRCYASTGSVSCLNGQCAPATATPTPTRPPAGKTLTPYPTLIFE